MTFITFKYISFESDAHKDTDTYPTRTIQHARLLTWLFHFQLCLLDLIEFDRFRFPTNETTIEIIATIQQINRKALLALVSRSLLGSTFKATGQKQSRPNKRDDREMPRILTPNSSFQRRNSNTYRVNVTYRPQWQRQYSDTGATSRVTHTKSPASFHSWQYHSNTPTSSEGMGSPPYPTPSQSTTPTSPSRFRVVTNHRRKSLPDPPSSTSYSYIPNKEEDAWGQFVDVTEEEEKIIRHSRILSRAS